MIPELPGPSAGEEDLSALLEEFRKLCTEQKRLIAEQASMLRHSRKIFARASEAARIGVWECELSDSRLTWTDVVYDIFGLPRGSEIDRERTLAAYEPQSRAVLEKIRSQAIQALGGFELDAQIVTPAGETRWIRITASVESEDGRAVRIFGMKQDITKEKLLADRTHRLANFDSVTGLANRGRFQAALDELDGSTAGQALLLIDLDGFKQVNDALGHAAGDECLRISAARLEEVCREATLVARVGGDEFAVLLGPDEGIDRAAALAGKIVAALGAPIESAHTPFAISGSIGIARMEGGSSRDLFLRADAALYETKAKGRNGYRIAASAGANAD